MLSEPRQYRALKLSGYGAPLELEYRTIPTPSAGQAVIRILATSIAPYLKHVIAGTRPYPLFFPLTPGSKAIARIESVGPDAVDLKAGELVYFDIVVRARDDPATTILLGFHGGATPAAQKLMQGVWRNGTFAEYATVPLENVHRLNEDLLIRKMGYSPASLVSLTTSLVAYGGLRDIDLKAGEKIIIAPATGTFGGSGVLVALALGAIVIAAGRNKDILQRMHSAFSGTGRFRTVQLTGDVSTDTEALIEASGDPAGADAFLDFSPREAAKSTHIAAALGALRHSGRVSLMGGIQDNIEIPYLLVMYKCLRIHGKYMYERQDVVDMIKMIEAGLFKIGGKADILDMRSFSLGEATNALDAAEAAWSWGGIVVLEP